MVPGVQGFGPLDRLGLRLAVVLGVALLPLGMIAIYQTYRVIDEANERVEAALLGETLNAAAAERRIVTHTMGVGDTLAKFIPDLLDDPEACNTRMKDAVNGNPNIVFAGFITKDGLLRCASEGVGRDLSDRATFLDWRKSPRAIVTIAAETAITKQTAIVVIDPVIVNGEPIGYIALTVPNMAIAIENVSDQKISPFDILTFDAEGKSLTSTAGLQSVQSRLPASRALSTLNVSRGVVFRDMDAAGRNRIFTVVPLVSDQIFALATWPASEALITPGRLMSTVALPILMWLTSVVVAYIAVHRLVIRHIRNLRRNIRTFSASRRIRMDMDTSNITAELREVIDAFVHMTDRIIRDEAEQEDLLHEKDVLLKEVHHRVKNNLQLIASITNMQIRKAQHPEARFLLRRLQDRVMGLATVHRSLYEASVFSEIRADTLIADIARQLANSAIIPGTKVQFTLKTDPVTLYPDQAVPLSLLVTEAVTNAFKYLGRPDSGAPWVSVTLTKNDDGAVMLEVANSTGTPVMPHDESAVSGLGSQLIGAFIMQLGGHGDIGEKDGVYRANVVFDPADFEKQDG
ncbi:sensor histidine kinase [Oceaniglobus indicus]|uniref:sensor histidine kinase n=1 Tax=Oceaniglobus indicus TaxID=2047749 RepID=UPI000C179EAD|nr:sensor histidine kinase [Oceaniglobus indicus]